MTGVGPEQVGLLASYAAVMVATAALVVRHVRWRRAERETAGLPELLEVVAARLRSGMSLVASLPQEPPPAASPVEARLADLRSRLAIGLHRGEAIEEWSRGLIGDDWSVVSAVLSIGTGLGGGDARALDHAAASLRDRHLRRLAVRTQAAQARASALLVGVSPWIITLVSWAGGGEGATLLASTRWGQWCLSAAAGLDLAGAHWMFQLVGATERRVGGV